MLLCAVPGPPCPLPWSVAMYQSMGVCFRPLFGGYSGCFPFCAVPNKAVGTVPVPVSWCVSVKVPVVLTDQELANFFVKGQIVNTSGVVTACCHNRSALPQ